jgi:N-ethylmaleimide reductase
MEVRFAASSILTAFGRHFVSNPDLPHRIHKYLPLTPYDRDTFFAFDKRGCTAYSPAPVDARI